MNKFLTQIQTVKYNLGILIIRFGYHFRKYQTLPKDHLWRWNIGVFILKYGYKLRGSVPYKLWSGNHI